MSEYLFTSESVSEGHPDKVADQISDAILDAVLSQDPTARVAAETLVNTGLCLLAGEITTTAKVDYIKTARDTIKKIGYNSSEMGFDADESDHSRVFDHPADAYIYLLSILGYIVIKNP